MLSLASTDSLNDDVKRLKHAFYIVLIFTTFLWCIKVLEFLLDTNFNFLGVQPHSMLGLVGVLTAPLIHGSFGHLIANTPAIIILGTATIYGYPKSCWFVVPIIWIGAELGVWITARPFYHFGTSTLSYGFMFFIFFIGILRKDKQAVALSLLVFFLYGTMIWGIFPHQPGVSFESHLWGAGMGIICAFIFRNLDPAPPRKHYTWEEADEEDSEISDA